MGPIRLEWIASEVAISEVSRKITRRHNRRESGRNGDAKGERFSLQGKRWRFPRGLRPEIIETRKSRIREQAEAWLANVLGEEAAALMVDRPRG